MHCGHLQKLLQVITRQKKEIHLKRGKIHSLSASWKVRLPSPGMWNKNGWERWRGVNSCPAHKGSCKTRTVQLIQDHPPGSWNLLWVAGNPLRPPPNCRLKRGLPLPLLRDYRLTKIKKGLRPYPTDFPPATPRKPLHHSLESYSGVPSRQLVLCLRSSGIPPVGNSS